MSNELSVEDVAKRRKLIVDLLSHFKTPREIVDEMGITHAEFNRLMRETPGLADEVHAVVQAMAVGERSKNLETVVRVRDTFEDGASILGAVDRIERMAGVSYRTDDGVPNIVIMGRTVNVASAKAGELEELMRVAAERVGDDAVVRYVDEKIAGKTQGETK